MKFHRRFVFIEEKSCNLLSFLASFMKSYTIIIKIWSNRWLLLFCILGKNVFIFLDKNSFISQNDWSLTGTMVMVTENNLWKFEFDLIISGFYRYLNLKCKIQRNNSEWFKAFLMSLFCHLWWTISLYSLHLLLLLNVMIHFGRLHLVLKYVYWTRKERYHFCDVTFLSSRWK